MWTMYAPVTVDAVQYGNLLNLWREDRRPTLNNIHTLFLNALGAALKNEPLCEENISSEELLGLLQMAEVHQVLPMVFEAVYSCAGAEAQILRIYRLRSIQLVAIQAQKTAEFLPLLKELHNAGAKPSGVVTARTDYARPPVPSLRTGLSPP